MNVMNMSVSAVGNHELDHGVAGLRVRTAGGCPGAETCSPGETRDAAHYQYLAANMVTDDGKTVLPATAIRTVGGVKIGFIGETLQETGDMVSPNATAGLHFLEESSVANAAAAGLDAREFTPSSC